MKDTGFVKLLNHYDLKAENVGFMKDQYGRRGVSAKMTTGKGVDYAVWFIQKDFPEGIYAVAVTKLKSCMIFPMYKYYQGRDMQKVLKFVEELVEDEFTEQIEDIVHPWTELGKRIMTV